MSEVSNTVLSQSRNWGALLDELVCGFLVCPFCLLLVLRSLDWSPFSCHPCVQAAVLSWAFLALTLTSSRKFYYFLEDGMTCGLWFPRLCILASEEHHFMAVPSLTRPGYQPLMAGWNHGIWTFLKPLARLHRCEYFWCIQCGSLRESAPVHICSRLAVNIPFSDSGNHMFLLRYVYSIGHETLYNLKVEIHPNNCQITRAPTSFSSGC